MKLLLLLPLLLTLASSQITSQQKPSKPPKNPKTTSPCKGLDMPPSVKKLTISTIARTDDTSVCEGGYTTIGDSVTVR